MKTYTNIKNYTARLWKALTIKSMGLEEDKLEVVTFLKYLDYVINTLIFLYVIFGAGCVYFFITHAILN